MYARSRPSDLAETHRVHAGCPVVEDRLILIIPQFIVLLFVMIAWAITAIIGWFAILFAGRYPDGLWEFGEGVMRWLFRVEAHFLLLHDKYPPFSLK